MSRAPGVKQPLILPAPPEKYDPQDQREVRRLIEQANRTLPDWSSVITVPENVTSLGGLVGAADKVPYFTGLSTMALATLTPYARTILACADAAAARAVIGPISESDMSLSDVTTLDVSTAKHGFAPKAPNNSALFLDGTGAYSAPPTAGFPPALPTFPSIASLVGRFSAEPTVSTLTIQSDGFVSQVNDASGSWGSNFTATTTARPRWLKRGMNTLRPGLQFNGSQTKLVAGATKTIAQPLTVVVVVQNWISGAANANLFRDSAGGPVLFLNQASGNAWTLFAGSSLAGTGLVTTNIQTLPEGMTGAPAIVIGVCNGASSIISGNGVEITGAAGATGISGTMRIGGDSTTSFAKMVLYEILFFNAALTPTERGQINTYYATALDINL